jgi:hypothetical protein
MKNYNNFKYTIGSLLYMQQFVDMFLPLCDYTHYMLKHSTLVMILHENMDLVDNMDDIEHMTKIDNIIYARCAHGLN